MMKVRVCTAQLIWLGEWHEGGCVWPNTWLGWEDNECTWNFGMETSWKMIIWKFKKEDERLDNI